MAELDDIIHQPLRLRIMAGRHCEADCIARDMTDALAEEIATLIISGSM